LNQSVIGKGAEVDGYLMSGKFLETKRVLTAKFGGCTAMSSAEGSWIDKDIEHNDSM
jgi:hypothetical protein